MSQPKQQAITGETGHRYFTQMLNMSEDDLDPFQYRLLAHYVRWAGYGGIAQETIKQTAQQTQMSEKKVRAVRAQLIELGYLHVYEPTLKERGDGIPAIVEVLDRWLENVERYSTREPQAYLPEVSREPDADIPQVPEVKTHEVPEANMPHLKELKSIEDQDSSAPNEGAEISPEKKVRKEVERSQVFATLARETFGVADSSALDKTTVILVNRLERWLKDNSPGATDETLKAFYLWYDKVHDGISRPRDPAKFGVHFIAFRQQHLIQKHAPDGVVTAGKKIVAAETDWRRDPTEAQS